MDWKQVIIECSKRENLYHNYMSEILSELSKEKVTEILNDMKDDFKFISEIKEKSVPTPVLAKVRDLENSIQNCITFLGSLLLINQFLK